jgi:hypothetical protein
MAVPYIILRPLRFERRTNRLKAECSTAELRALICSRIPMLSAVLIGVKESERFITTDAVGLAESFAVIVRWGKYGNF